MGMASQEINALVLREQGAPALDQLPAIPNQSLAFAPQPFVVLIPATPGQLSASRSCPLAHQVAEILILTPFLGCLDCLPKK